MEKRPGDLTEGELRTLKYRNVVSKLEREIYPEDSLKL